MAVIRFKIILTTFDVVVATYMPIITVSIISFQISTKFEPNQIADFEHVSRRDFGLFWQRWKIFDKIHIYTIPHYSASIKDSSNKKIVRICSTMKSWPFWEISTSSINKKWVLRNLFENFWYYVPVYGMV